ncbi:MAG: asparagine synthase (glutamine-hydrolyzing) [Solirubrobacterales bacterium]
MCGIAGCVLEAGRAPERERLEAMRRALHHRGPDASGVEVFENVGLVNTRLAIVDPTADGAQPMLHPSGDWALTYNGEVFNHLDLRRELAEARFRGGSDTETVLEAIHAWGERALPRLNGLFAFAAFDRSARRLLLVRDRFGVKPLYLARRPEGLWFASEIAALVAAGIRARPRPDVVAHCLDYGWANGSRTPVEGVDRLMPGTVLDVDAKTLETRERRWYRPAEAVLRDRRAQLSVLGRSAATDAVESALRRSVELRLMADVPVGTMCSGGLDSSLITKLAADAHPRIVAFNAAITDQPDADESRWAERVAQAAQIELVTARVSADSWRAGLVDVVRHVEYPLNHESSVAMWQIADLARQAGVKVLLSGEGADELFGGYTWVGLHERADFAARNRRAESALRALARRSPWLLDAYRRLRGDLSARPIAGAGAPSERVREFERGVERAALDAYADSEPRSRSELEANLLCQLELYLPHLLNRQDKTTMKASVETREPFLDPDLVELAVNLPLELRVEPEPKAILRELGRRHLPPEITERTKGGFGWDYARYLSPAARPEFLIDGALRELRGIDRERWSALVASTEVWQLPLWTAEIWMRTVIGGQSTERVEAELWR